MGIGDWGLGREMRYVLIYLIGKGLSRVPYQAIIEVTFFAICNKN